MTAPVPSHWRKLGDLASRIAKKLEEPDVDENIKLRQALHDLVRSLDHARQEGATFGYGVGVALTRAKDALK